MIKLCRKHKGKAGDWMRAFDYAAIRQELFTPEIVNLLTAIHEYKGKQELFIEAQPDVLKAMLEVASHSSLTKRLTVNTSPNTLSSSASPRR